MFSENKSGKKMGSINGSYLRAAQRPTGVVEKRNARERKRVHTVNQAFLMLKYHLPSLRSRSKRVSKLKILKVRDRHRTTVVVKFYFMNSLEMEKTEKVSHSLRNSLRTNMVAA